MKRLALVSLVAVLAFTACGGDTEPTTIPTTPAPTQSTPASTPTQTASGTVNVASSSLGSILVDAQGRTLYLFMNDTAGKSNCSGGCATNWPPLEATGAPTGGTGVDASLLGTTQRDDGKSQVVYNQHPLYHFAADAAAGDTKGQGVGGNWYVVSPAGEPITS
jgi:predicted lipoprotein with Yx(FWY)xxD motif